MKQISHFLGLSLACCLLACQSETTEAEASFADSAQHAMRSAQAGDGSFRKQEPPTYSYDASFLYSMLKEERKREKEANIHFVTQDAKANLFFLFLDKATGEHLEANPVLKKTKGGLRNSEGNIILPAQYNKLYNIGGTVAHWMEVEKGGKLGLFNPSTLKLIPAQFDAIYPYPNSEEVLAQVELGGKYGWLSAEDFEAHFEATSFDDARLFRSPFESNLCQQWQYRIKDEYVLPFIGGDEFQLQYDEWNALAVVPSYLQTLRILPQKLYNVNNALGMDMVLDGRFAIEEQNSDESKGGIQAFLSSFYVEGVGSRDYHYSQANILVRKEEKTEVKSIEKKAGLICASPAENYLRFVGPGLIEVKQERGLPQYTDATCYEYYQLDASGKLAQLHKGRLFASASLVKLDESYFEGCFSYEREENSEEYMGQPFWQQNYLSIEDLDIMRNELFAAKGLRFKSKKWQDYFAKQRWYKAQYDSVDDKLSELEKKNIETILKMKATMEKDKSYSERHKTYYIAAG